MPPRTIIYGLIHNVDRRPHVVIFSNIRRMILNVVGIGASAGFTNLLGIYEYGSTSNLLMGSKWCAPNGIYYSFSMRLQKDHLYAPYGRANTRYYNMHGLSTVSIEGQSRVN